MAGTGGNARRPAAARPDREHRRFAAMEMGGAGGIDDKPVGRIERENRA